MPSSIVAEDEHANGHADSACRRPRPDPEGQGPARWRRPPSGTSRSVRPSPPRLRPRAVRAGCRRRTTAEPAWRVSLLRRHLGIFPRSCYRNIVVKALFLRCRATSYQPKKGGERMDETNPIVMSEVTDPVELAKARKRWEQADRNSAWLQAHVPEIYSRHRGKCICVAGEELFVADTPRRSLRHGEVCPPGRRRCSLSLYPQREGDAHLCEFQDSGFSVMTMYFGPLSEPRSWRSMGHRFFSPLASERKHFVILAVRHKDSLVSLQQPDEQRPVQ